MRNLSKFNTLLNSANAWDTLQMQSWDYKTFFSEATPPPTEQKLTYFSNHEDDIETYLYTGWLFFL